MEGPDPNNNRAFPNVLLKAVPSQLSDINKNLRLDFYFDSIDQLRVRPQEFLIM